MTSKTLQTDEPRLLIKALLEPVQGRRFQPTGFPDLGAALFKIPGQGAARTQALLVESAQSMANRAEAVCWDDAKRSLVPALQGLPYVHVEVVDAAGERITETSSVQEAHRLNSPYVLDGQLGDRAFKDIFLKELNYREGAPVDRRELARVVFKYDPAALLHGLFISNIGDGRMRISRALSGFIEAYDAEEVRSGGVKNDQVNPSGDTAKGFGNVPFHRVEYAAQEIYAYFNLDLRQIRSYGLPEPAQRLLVELSQYKIRRVLHDGLRLRTACDLVCAQELAELPPLAALEVALPKAIHACAALFANPVVTRLKYRESAASGKASKKASEKTRS